MSLCFDGKSTYEPIFILQFLILEEDLFAIILALSQCHSIGRGDPCLHPKVVGRQRLGEGDGSDGSDGPFICCEK